MKTRTYPSYEKDITRLVVAVASGINIGALHTLTERMMGLIIVALVLWLSFLLDHHDVRNQVRAARLLAKQPQFQLKASISPEFLEMLARGEKSDADDPSLDLGGLFPVGGGAQPAPGGIPFKSDDSQDGFRLIHRAD